MSRQIRRWDVMAKIVKDRKYKLGVEVGVLNGAMMRQMLELCPELHMIGVDIKLTVDALAVGRDFVDRCTLVQGKSVEVARLVRPYLSLDFVFIDADHSYGAVRADIDAWSRRVKPGGTVAGHDYAHERHTGVKPAVDEFFPGDVTTHPDYVWEVRL